MAILSRVIDGLDVYHLKAEEKHRAGLEEDARKAYRMTEFSLAPPTPDEAALFRDQQMSGAFHRGALQLVRAKLKKISPIRTRSGAFIDVEAKPGEDMAAHLQVATINELAGRLDELADLDAEDFG